MDSSGNNRYELLFMDDDITDPLDNIVAKKKQAKSAASGGGAGSGANTKANTSSGKQNNNVDTSSSKAQQAHKKQPNQAEKENKPSAMNKNDSGGNKRATGGGTASVSFNDKVSSRSIGSSNVNSNSNSNRKRNGPQSTEIREGGGQGRNPTSRQQNGETREQRNNRRNNGFNNSTGVGGTATVTDGSQQQQRQFRDRGENRGPPRANNRNFDANNRGRKREFDRQSGSDKTGVKAIDKRDGAGARNWGSVKDAIDESNKTDSETVEKADESINEPQQPVEQAPIEEETKEITFDEWKAQKQQRVKPQFNIRKAGEGEDTSQWKKMIALNNNKKKEVESEEELEYDPAMYPQRVGRQQRLLDIQFNFNDGRRGGGGFGGRGRGRGPRPGGYNAGGGGGGGGGSGNNNGGGANMMANGERGGGGVSNGGNVGTGGGGGDRQRAAPKVNDERQFPTLA